MKNISIEQRIVIPFFGIVATFIISRMFYDMAGIRFQWDTYLSYWQFIDPVLLENDLWRSIFYLHSQPPLMNLLTGIVLQGTAGREQQIFHFLYFITGLILAVSLYMLGICMRQGPWSSMFVSILFIISPVAVLYEHWLTYNYLLAATLTLAAVFLYKFASTGKISWGLMFFSLLAMNVLTWSLFHITWLIASIIILLIFLPHRKQVILSALVPVVIATAWYAKNLWLVGEFTASSWAGMNISKIVTFRTPEKERKQMVKSGELSKFALLPPFRNPSAYLKLLPDTPITGIPLWDQPQTSLGFRNHHHLVYVAASEYYLRDALYIVRSRPGYYLRSIVQAFYIYFHSSSDFDLTMDNRDRIRAWDTWWNRLFYGQWQSDETSIDRNAGMSLENVGWWIVIAFFTVIIGSLRLLWKRRTQMSDPQNLLILFMTYNILFVTLVGNLMDIGENNRFRFVIDPFLMILFVYLLRNAIPSLFAGKTAKE